MTSETNEKRESISFLRQGLKYITLFIITIKIFQNKYFYSFLTIRMREKWQEAEEKEEVALEGKRLQDRRPESLEIYNLVHFPFSAK